MENPEPSRRRVAVRRAVADDADQIRALAVDNGMFAPDDLDAFDEMLNGYLEGSLDGHSWLVAQGQPTLYEFAGGEQAILAPTAAHHARCLATRSRTTPSTGPDQNPRHVERPAAYWAEVTPTSGPRW
jgi:hypothetical protein